MNDPTARAPGAPTPPAAPPDLSPIAQQLRRLRARAARLLILTGVATLLACLIAAFLAVGIADYLLRTPAWFRGVLWVGGLAGLVVAIRRWIVPAWQFRPSLTEVALRLERSEHGKKAGLTGILASGLELASSTEGPRTTQWMAGRVVEEAGRRFAGVRASAILSRAHAQHALLTLGVCAAGLVAVGLLAGPRLSAIGAARVFAPWSDAQWPKRTALADITAPLNVHPLGMALPLRAAVTRTNQPVSATRVTAVYRLIDSSGEGPLKRILLTGQGRPVAVPTTEPDGLASGELYERLIEPGTLAAATGTQAELEYWFETGDDRTEPGRIKLVPPPAIVAASAVVTSPEYVQGTAEPGAAPLFASGPIEMGAGADQRAVVGPVLAGSTIDLTIRFNKPLPGPPQDQESAAAAWAAATFPGAKMNGWAATYSGEQWKLTWVARESLRLPVRPTDQYGLRPSEAEESIFAFDVAEDRPPTATVIEPREDESVLATAVVEIGGEARDDVGIASLSLTRQLARPAQGSLGAAPEPVGEQSAVPAQADAGQSPTRAGVTTTLDLSAFGLKPGEELWVRAVAADTYSFEGVKHDPVQSSPRKLRIIREEDLIDQVRAELAAVRKIAIRMEGEQGELRKSAQSGSVSADDRRRQAGLTQRITQQQEAMERLESRLERNRLEDQTLSGILSDISGLLQSAAQDSERASAQMDAAAKDRPEAESAPLDAKQAQEVTQAQDSVRDQLARLAEMLDRGEDSWLMSRTLQRLAEQQRELESRTRRAGERNMGKRAEDLTPQERAELSEIAEQQQRLSDAARQAIDQLTERGKQLESADAAQSEGMKKAAERGREQQVPQKMQEAAKNAQQNQTSAASEQQEAAADALEQMLQDMNDAQKNRDEQLRRVLANLLQSLDLLIREQETQVTALAAAVPESKFEGLDAPMIALNQNTLEVAEKARGDRSMVRVAELVDRAAKSQEGAIGSLRAAPVAAEEAEKAERESLRLLRLARAEAQKLSEEAQKRDMDRKRQELRKVYRETLELQVALTGETSPFIGKTVDRRDRMKVRGLGERQEALRVSLEELRKKTAEMEDASVFDYAHTRLDQAAGGAGKKLRAGQADRVVARNQGTVVTLLTALIQALDDQAKKDDEFSDAPGGDGGGGGGGGGSGNGEQPLLPPLTELRLLRAMQQEAADVTRAIHDAEGPSAEEMSGLGELQRGLSERGQELIQKLQQPGPGEAPEQPEGKSP